MKITQTLDVLAAVGDVAAEKFETAPDILQALQANAEAWQNFQTYSESYQRIRIAFIESARSRPAEFQKRLKHFLQKTEQNKQFGFGIETYF